MKNKVLLSRLCICTLTVSLLAGCSSAGSTSEHFFGNSFRNSF